MIPRAISRRIRKLGFATLVSAAWSNRQDLSRWLKFIRGAITQRKTRTFSDLATEFRIRAAVSANTLLRRDPALLDLTVHNGVVNLLTTTDEWPDLHHKQMLRLKCVKGVSEVTSSPE